MYCDFIFLAEAGERYLKIKKDNSSKIKIRQKESTKKVCHFKFRDSF
jgi:hypothetical protein